MKHITTNNFAGGSCLKGYLTATRRKIESVFGSPLEFGEGDKVTTEWVVEFEDGTIATIYDWKRYEDGAPELDENCVWNIGGYSMDAVKALKKALGVEVREFTL